MHVGCIYKPKKKGVRHSPTFPYCDHLPYTTFHFYLIDFQLNIDFPSQFCVFTVKSPSVTQRSVSQENAFKKSKNPSPFFRKIIGSNNSFTLIENNFRFLKYQSLNSR